MNIKQKIKLARQHLNNPIAYANLMSSFIRSSLSDRQTKEYRIAINEDGLEDYFLDLNTDCPRSKH